MSRHAAPTPTSLSKASHTVIRDHLPEPGPERDQAIQNALRILVSYQPAPAAQARRETAIKIDSPVPHKKPVAG